MDEPTRVAIARWLENAERDLFTARTMLATKPAPTDVVCYHCQQCGEKALKAYLVFANVHVEKTHYLRRLVELCAQVDTSFDGLQDAATALSDYVADRYPDNWREIPLDEAREALNEAERLLQFVRARLPDDVSPRRRGELFP